MDEFNDMISHWQLADGESQDEMTWKISADDKKTHKDKVSATLKLIILFDLCLLQQGARLYIFDYSFVNH